MAQEGFRRAFSPGKLVERECRATHCRASHFHMYSAGLEINIFSRSLQVSPSLSLSLFFASIFFLFLLTFISLFRSDLFNSLHARPPYFAYLFARVYARIISSIDEIFIDQIAADSQGASGTRWMSTLTALNGKNGWSPPFKRRYPLEILASSRGEDRVSARASSFRKISKDPWKRKAVCVSLEYPPLENVSSIVLPGVGGPPGAGNEGVVRS